jgi:hypothetical protein
MASDFLNGFAARANLTPVEQTVLANSDVRSAADVHSLVKSFPSIAQLGVRVPALAEAAAQEVSPAFAVAAAQPLHAFKIGAAPAGIALPSVTQVAAAAMPAAPGGAMNNPIDLRLPGWGVKNQGNRDACVAFATAACVEHLQAAGGNIPDLSEQFLYWATKAYYDPDKTHESSKLDYARAALANIGICPDNLCRYSDAAFNPAAGPTPSEPARQAAANDRIAATTYQLTPMVKAQTIYNLLSAGRPVAVSLFRYHDPSTPQNEDNWSNHSTQYYGRVMYPPTTQALLRGSHSVCVTGYRPDPGGSSGGGYFIFKNSWGPGWATWAGPPNSYAPESGYGDMSVNYVNLACWEILQL